MSHGLSDKLFFYFREMFVMRHMWCRTFCSVVVYIQESTCRNDCRTQCYVRPTFYTLCYDDEADVCAYTTRTCYTCFAGVAYRRRRAVGPRDAFTSPDSVRP